MSKRLPWFRVWDDLDDDPKIRLVASVTGQKIATIKGVYLQMLLHANSFDDDKRGTLAGWNDLLMSVKTGLTVDELSAIRNTMQGLLLDGEQLHGWTERQKGKVKEDRTNAQRQARYRAAMKAKAEKEALEAKAAQAAKAAKEAEEAGKDNGQGDNSNGVTPASNGVTGVTNNASNSVTEIDPADPDSNAPRNAPVTPKVTPYKEERSKSKELKTSDTPDGVSGDAKNRAAQGDGADPDSVLKATPCKTESTGENDPATPTMTATQPGLFGDPEKPPVDDPGGSQTPSGSTRKTAKTKAEPKPRPPLVQVDVPAYLDFNTFEKYLVVRVRAGRPVDKTSQEALLILIADLRDRYDVNKLVTMATLANWGNVHGHPDALLPNATGFRPARGTPVAYDEHGFGEHGQANMAAAREAKRLLGIVTTPDTDTTTFDM